MRNHPPLQTWQEDLAEALFQSGTAIKCARRPAHGSRTPLDRCLLCSCQPVSHPAVLPAAPLFLLPCRPRFGLAFCEASGDRKVRWDGNDTALVDLAKKNALAIGAGHRWVGGGSRER